MRQGNDALGKTGSDISFIEFAGGQKDKEAEVVDMISHFFDCAVRNVVSHETFTAGELPKRLEKVIEDTFQIAGDQSGQAGCIAKGISLGIIRSRKLPEREIRSVLEATARIVVDKVLKIGGDTESAVQGYVEGVLEGSDECGLDGHSCAAFAARGAVMAGYHLGGETGDLILDLVLKWMSDTGLIDCRLKAA